jgi:hypothetical protein
MNKQVRIIPKRREIIDFPRLAEALLDVVASLSPTERKRFESEGERVLKTVEGGRKPKRGNAA